MLTIPRTDLVAVLEAAKATVGKATEQNPLSLVVLEGGRAWCTNYDEWRYRDVPTMSGEGRAVLPVLEVLKGVKSLRGDVVTLDTTTTEHEIERSHFNQATKQMEAVKEITKTHTTLLRCGTFRLELRDLPFWDIEEPAAWEVVKEFARPAKTLGELLRKTTYCMSVDETRPYLNGVWLRVGTDECTWVATDGHRLAVTTDDGAPSYSSDTFDLIVGSGGIWEIERMLKANKTEVAWVSLESKLIQPEKPTPYRVFRLRVSVGPDSVVTRGLDETYPDYTRVIPERNPVQCVVSVSAFESGMDALRPWLSKTTRIVRFDVHPSSLDISATDPKGRLVEDKIPCTITGLPKGDAFEDQEHIKIGFHEGYLKDVTDRLDESTMTIQLRDQFTPAVIVEGRTTHVVMPMRV